MFGMIIGVQRINYVTNLCKRDYLKDPYKSEGEKLKRNKNRKSWNEERLVMVSFLVILKRVILWH